MLFLLGAREDLRRKGVATGVGIAGTGLADDNLSALGEFAGEDLGVDAVTEPDLYEDRADVAVIGNPDDTAFLATVSADGAPYVQRERERLQQAADMVAVGLTLGRRPPQVEAVAHAERARGVPLS